MSEADAIEEELGILKIYLVALAALDLILLGWLANNYDAVARLYAVLTLVAILAVTFGLIWVNRVAYARFEKLEKL